MEIEEDIDEILMTYFFFGSHEIWAKYPQNGRTFEVDELIRIPPNTKPGLPAPENKHLEEF